MTHIVVTSWWPYSKTEEVTSKWNEILPRFTASAKSVKYFFKPVKKGVRAMGFFEIEEGKFEDSYTALYTLAMEFTEIDGYTFEMDTQLSLEEAQAAQAAQG
ncbi:MAG: hypothetical protein ACW96X_01050 [Promethearchaeota archaeon]|jgi:hypothetical protein